MGNKKDQNETEKDQHTRLCLQNERFVRDFLQISRFQLENRRFCASFSYKAIFTELKKYDFCEASATFQDNRQILRLPRYLQ